MTCSTASGIREDKRSITVFVLAQAKQSISCCLSIGDKATVTVFGWCLHGSLINSFKIVWHLLFLHQLSQRSISLGFLLCFECFETVALWQHCIDYNTDSARLSVLQTVCTLEDRCLLKQTKKNSTDQTQSLQHIITHLPAVLRPPSIWHLVAHETHRKITAQGKFPVFKESSR